MSRPLPSMKLAGAAELRPFQAIRLIAADLDGTLVGSDGRLWLSILALVRVLRAHGVHFTIATGRTLAGVRPLLHAAGPAIRDPLVLYNGAIVVEPVSGRVLERRVIPADDVSVVATLAHTLDVDVLAYHYEGPDETLLGVGGERVRGWTSTPRPTKIDYNGQLIEWEHRGPATDACAILVDTRRCVHCETLDTELARMGQFTVTSSGGHYRELRPLGSHKWSALSSVANWLTVTSRQTLAIGDSFNDIDMLRGAGIGVCVAGAPPELDEHSDYRAQCTEAAAVLETLRTVHSALRYGPALERFSVAH